MSIRDDDDTSPLQMLTMEAPQPQRAGGDPGGQPRVRALRIADIPLALVDARSDQPRQRMARGSMRELVDSVRLHGILQPIRVRPKGDRYEIIAGARRCSAAREVGLSTVPAVIVEAGDDEAYLEALVENIQREDLNPLDRAQALMRLRVSLGIRTWEEVGAMIGIRRAHVYRLLSIARLPEVIREGIRVGDLTEKHGRALLSLRGHPRQQSALWERIQTEHLSGDDAIREASSWRRDLADRAPTASEGTADPNGEPQSHAPVTEPVTRNGTTTAADRRQELVEAIQTASRALAAATAEDRAAVTRELGQLGDVIQAALRDHQAAR
jgi:ParB/RepB/Spo0J family partition protein